MLPGSDIAENQEAIMRWLESRGHRVELGGGEARPSFKDRSCTLKKRYATAVEAAASVGDKMEIYSCRFCGGFHAATPRS